MKAALVLIMLDIIKYGCLFIFTKRSHFLAALFLLVFFFLILISVLQIPEIFIRVEKSRINSRTVYAIYGFVVDDGDFDDVL